MKALIRTRNRWEQSGSEIGERGMAMGGRNRKTRIKRYKKTRSGYDYDRTPERTDPRCP